ncbi:MAG: ankyrin repeat domain-containing protein [Colwellia sp.]
MKNHVVLLFKLGFKLTCCSLLLCLQGCSDNNQLLLDALRSNDDVTAKRLLAQNTLNMQFRDKFGYTALHLANNVEITRLLIKQGADVNAKGAGVDPNIKPIKNIDLGKFGNFDLNELKRGNDYSPLHTVKNAEVAKLLIKHGAKVNALANYDITPLHKAADRKNGLVLAKFFLKNGAKVNARTFYNATPLHKAMFYANHNNAELVKLLITQGANVNAQDNLGHAPLHQIRSGNVELASYLVEQGADTTIKTISGDSPLCYAIAGNRIALMHFYIIRGKGILSKCSKDRSIFQYTKDEARNAMKNAVKEATVLILKEFKKSQDNK